MCPMESLHHNTKISDGRSDAKTHYSDGRSDAIKLQRQTFTDTVSPVAKNLQRQIVSSETDSLLQ